MPRPAPDWLDALPRDRLLGEFSLWSADLLNLEHDLHRIEPHAAMLHVDVADGHFAPPLLFFPDLVAAIRRATSRPIHVHLMVADAALISQIDQFAEAGADLISLHAETANVARGLDRIAAHGLKAGLVLRVDTPVADVVPHLDHLHALTLLGTAIGVKGQGLDASAGDRLREAADLIRRSGHPILLCADGGIREHTVPLLRAAGAQTIVLGSLAFGAPDLPRRMEWLRAL